MNERELLVIDDEESIHEVLEQYLAPQGMTLFSALNGHDGLEMLYNHPGISMVLCDYRIPDGDGLEVLRRIKERDPAVQVVLMTAYSDKNIAIRALRLGADDYLEKPFHLDDLTATLKRARERSRVRSFSLRSQHVLEHLPLGFVFCSPDGVVEGITASAQNLISYRSKNAIGRSLWEVSGLEATKALFGSDREAPEKRQVELGIGSRWVSFQLVETTAETGRPSELIVVSDATQHRQLREELDRLTTDLDRRVEERTRSLSAEVDFIQNMLDTAGVVIVYIDPEGGQVRINRFAEELTGFSRSRLEEVFKSLMHDVSSPLSVLLDPNLPDEISGTTADLPTSEGGRRVLMWSARQIEGQSRSKGKLVIGIDVTEQKQLEATLQNYNLHLEEIVENRTREIKQKEAQLIHTARLASLGEMTAGIAHELKQPLNVISITSDLIKLLHRNNGLSEELLYSNLDKIRLTVERMAKTINQLRGFTRMDSANFINICVEDAIEGALAIIGEQIRQEDIELIREVQDKLPPIRGELNQIEQVFVNLLQNARDAIVEKTARNDWQDGEPKKVIIRAGDDAEAGRVFVEVIDNGIGIERQVMGRLFEPFYTTKEPKRGTGLGLSISWDIVQTHGGVIEVSSTPNKSSTFRVVLPTTEDESENG